MNGEVKVRYTVKTATQRQNMIWSICASLTNSAHSVIMLALVSRISGNEGAGVYSLSYSVAQMMYFVCCFEMANVLITDSRKCIGFRDSAWFRVATNAVMLIFAVGFSLMRGFTGNTLRVFSALTVHMMLLSVAELCESHLHRSNYLNLAGCSLTCNLIICDVAFLVTLAVTKNITVSVVSMCFVTLVWILIYDIPYVRNAGITQIRSESMISVWKMLIRQCAPLVCMRLVMSYIMNAPKLSIDSYLTLVDQSYFGYMLMPASCVNLLSIFALRPQLVNLAMSYNNKDKKRFVGITRRIVVWDLLVTACVLVGGYFIGIPVLSFFYGADLRGMEQLLCTVLLGGCFYAFATLFDAVATTMRTHYWNLAIYLPTFLLASALSGYLVKSFGLMGAAWSYMLMMLLLAAGSGVILTITVKKKFTE